MPTRVIIRSDHEGLYQERPLYCPIYECRSFIPQARIDSHGVGTCIRCTAKSCCFCGKLGVHASHLNCPVVIRIMEYSSRGQDFANLYRSTSGRGRWRGMGSPVDGDEDTGDAPLFSLAIELGDDTGPMINSMEGHSARLVGRISLSANFSAAPEDLGDIETTEPHGRLTRDPYRVNSTRVARSLPIPAIPTGASPTTPASPVSSSAFRVQVESSPAAAPIAPTNTSTRAADADQPYNSRSRTRLSETLRRQMPDQDQIEIQRNRHRFALLRRVRQREYHRVAGSGFTHA